jgi:hypothetical protein
VEASTTWMHVNPFRTPVLRILSGSPMNLFAPCVPPHRLQLDTLVKPWSGHAPLPSLFMQLHGSLVARVVV